MPSKSIAQRRFFGMVDAFKEGKMPNASPMIKKASVSMTDKQVMDFASTKHKGLPEHTGNALRQAVSGSSPVIKRVAKAKMKKAGA